MENKGRGFMNSVQKRIAKTLYKQELLTKDDKILIALSGGKDSLILLENLADRRKYLPFNIELLAGHVIVEEAGYKTDIGYLKEFCSEANVPLILENVHVDLNKDQNKSVCFVCSWNRRRELFKMAHANGCNKIAFGHHMDDAIETLLLNMVYHASISSLPFKLEMFEGKIEIIRPLMELTDHELKKYSEFKGYKKEIKLCPHSGSTMRENMKEFTKELVSVSKNARRNIFNSMDNIYFDYLPKKPKK